DGGSVTPSVNGCVESIPSGATRPTLKEAFPARGTSGFAARFEVTVEHGKGEKVFPSGVELKNDGEAARILKLAGFTLPNQQGEAKLVGRGGPDAPNGR